MTFNRTFRKLALGAAVVGALSGCAGAQRGDIMPKPSQTRPESRPEPALSPVEKCKAGRKARVQDCIIETIVGGCKEGSAGDDDKFYSCVSDGLKTEDGPVQRQVSVTVSAGDEVLSMRVGGPVVMEVAWLEVAAIDERGIRLTFQSERLATAEPSERTPVANASARYNYDGTEEGDAWKFNGLPAWNLQVSSAARGRAVVSFETDEPGLLVRNEGAASQAK
jgi:hypothetical protein